MFRNFVDEELDLLANYILRLSNNFQSFQHTSSLSGDGSYYHLLVYIIGAR